MIITLFSNLSEKDKHTAVDQMIAESTPRQDFFFMILLSVLITTLGVLINNVAVVIGSMLVAPLLSPILSLALGIVMSNQRLITRSAITIGKSVLIAIPAAAIISLIGLSQIDAPTAYIPALALSATPSMSYAVIAFLSGVAASFAMIKPHLNTHLSGTVIAVALIPPLAVTGVGLAAMDFSLMMGAFVLFLINIACIVFASMIVFSLMNLYSKRHQATAAIQKEDVQLERELVDAQQKAKEE